MVPPDGEGWGWRAEEQLSGPPNHPPYAQGRGERSQVEPAQVPPPLRPARPEVLPLLPRRSPARRRLSGGRSLGFCWKRLVPQTRPGHRLGLGAHRAAGTIYHWAQPSAPPAGGQDTAS